MSWTSGGKRHKAITRKKAHLSFFYTLFNSPMGWVQKWSIISKVKKKSNIKNDVSKLLLSTRTVAIKTGAL